MKAREHRALGDEASGGAGINVGGTSVPERLEMSFGDVVALSGDYFYPTAEPALSPDDGAPGLRDWLSDKACQAYHQGRRVGPGVPDRGCPPLRRAAGPGLRATLNPRASREQRFAALAEALDRSGYEPRREGAPYDWATAPSTLSPRATATWSAA